MRGTNTQSGFTLIELMVSVAIIGIISAVAIPNFLSYQAKARRSEAYSNLSVLARAQQAYFTERGVYFEAGVFPDPGAAGINLGTTTMAWTSADQDAFAELGWAPDGQTFYAYDSNTGTTGCGCAGSCFTATAYGDVDEDDGLSAVMYVSPERDGTGAITDQCPAHLFGFGTPLNSQGNEVFDAVAVNGQSDNY